MAQTIEGFVGTSMDDARMSPLHYRVFALIAAGYFFDVADYVILGSLIPDMTRSGFATAPQIATVASATLFGLFIGTVAQGEFTDRFGRKTVYQFNLLLYGTATIAAAFSPDYIWLAALRFIAGIGLGAEQPLCFAYAGEYAPKNIRGRFVAGVQLIGGAFSWPLSTLFALAFRDSLGWRGCWIVIGLCALIVFLFRFSLPESPRWLATHGQGDRALDLLERMGLKRPPAGVTLINDAASNSHSDPIGVVFRHYRGRVIAAMVCFVAFFGVALGLGTWLPNMMADRGMTITKSLTYTFGMTLAFPCASVCMMFALEKFGRKKTAITAFALAGLFAVAFVNAGSDTMLLAVGFCMIFFIQLAGNSMQIFASEVFPTNARASGFGLAQGVGRLGTAFIIPTILWIQTGYGTDTVFMCVAVVLVIAAATVNLIGPESRGMPLDVLAPPEG
ncbi:MAG TPA: MFS transporter [Acetobacteraceae bacterium]|jgi:putative MFS transporter|nr:MFS transporter [Acetobacteraceae bacterium]